MRIIFFYDNMSLEEQLGAIIRSMYSPEASPAEHCKERIFSNETLRIYLQETRLAADTIHARFGVTKVTDITQPMFQWYLEKMRRNGRSGYAQYKACAAMCKAMQWSMGDFDTDRRPHNAS